MFASMSDLNFIAAANSNNPNVSGPSTTKKKIEKEGQSESKTNTDSKTDLASKVKKEEAKSQKSEDKTTA